MLISHLHIILWKYAETVAVVPVFYFLIFKRIKILISGR